MSKYTRPTPAMEYWFVQHEHGVDQRTGARASNYRRERRPTDPPGKEPTVWVWIVYLHVDGVQLLSGVAQNQGRARAAIRKFVRTLPDKKKAKA